MMGRMVAILGCDDEDGYRLKYHGVHAVKITHDTVPSCNGFPLNLIFIPTLKGSVLTIIAGKLLRELQRTKKRRLVIV